MKRIQQTDMHTQVTPTVRTDIWLRYKKNQIEFTINLDHAISAFIAIIRVADPDIRLTLMVS